MGISIRSKGLTIKKSDANLRMYLITENELLPAVGPHYLLHVTTDHGQGEALQGGGVVLRTIENNVHHARMSLKHTL